MSNIPFIFDGLQYCNWDRAIFKQMRDGNVGAVHATVVYHGNARETLTKLGHWNRLLQENSDLVVLADSAKSIRAANASKRTAILLGFQNPSPIEEELALVQVFRQLGVRFMQLTYNNQCALASGCYEEIDSGVTRFGREVIAEMNRVGMIIDMSHSGNHSTMQAIELSQEPITISHANPSSWQNHVRNFPNEVLQALAETGGMLGFSLYPLHLKDGSACQLDDFCAMVANTVELMGIEHVGIGSDLVQGQPNSVLAWMRDGRWRHNDAVPSWPPQPSWFQSNLDFGKIIEGLAKVGFNVDEIGRIMGQNWLDFLDRSSGN